MEPKKAATPDLIPPQYAGPHETRFPTPPLASRWRSQLAGRLTNPLFLLPETGGKPPAATRKWRVGKGPQGPLTSLLKPMVPYPTLVSKSLAEQRREAGEVAEGRPAPQLLLAHSALPVQAAHWKSMPANQKDSRFPKTTASYVHVCCSSVRESHSVPFCPIHTWPGSPSRTAFAFLAGHHPPKGKRSQHNYLSPPSEKSTAPSPPAKANPEGSRHLGRLHPEQPLQTVRPADRSDRISTICPIPFSLPLPPTGYLLDKLFQTRHTSPKAELGSKCSSFLFRGFWSCCFSRSDF